MENKTSLDCLLSWWHFCQKLSKSIHERWSYSKTK